MEILNYILKCILYSTLFIMLISYIIELCIEIFIIRDEKIKKDEL